MQKGKFAEKPTLSLATFCEAVTLLRFRAQFHKDFATSIKRGNPVARPNCWIKSKLL
jgi:hypothetical protein